MNDLPKGVPEMKETTESKHDGCRPRRFSLTRRAAFSCSALLAGLIIPLLAPSTAEPQPTIELTERVQVHPEFSVAHPAGWSVRQIANTQQMFAATAEAIDLGEVVLEDIAIVVIHTEQRTDHAEAVLRLKQIEAESDAPSRFVQIAGWPALQRQQQVDKPHAGPPGEPRPERATQMVVTTAIAVDALLVRLEAVLPSDATPEAITEVLMIGESVNTRVAGDPDAAQQEVDRLNSEPVLHSSGLTGQKTGDPAPLDGPPLVAASVLVAGAPLRVTSQAGIDAELEITTSTDGRDIVIGSNGNYFVSNDGGQSFAPSAGILGNDPSLAYGASGTFYAGNIGGACNTAILTSTNNGQSFANTTPAYTCPNAVPAPGPGGCVQDPQCGAGFPDQEHIAADRYNPAPGGDQVYSAWRSLWSNVGVGIVCSQDGGANWTNAIFTLGDFPRITVGQDGRVYVVYRRGNNIQLWRLSSCATGLVPSAPVVVVTGNPQVPCPVAGLNRCNDGNNLSSPTVAVDDTDANHIFVSYAVNTGPNNENVLLQDSLDGGANWGSCRSACGSPLPGDSLSPCAPGGLACLLGGEVCCPNTVQVSSGILGRRFMPWVCSVGGEAYVTWYDRRNATPADNSLTDFFAGSAERDGFVLNAGDEIQYTSVSDSHCGPPSTNWPGSAPRSNNDSESCSQQPQFAGQCRIGTCMVTCGTITPGDSLNACNPGGPACPGGEQCCTTVTGPRCDFSDCGTGACNMTATGQAGCQCPANQFCACAGGSPPKHGDYNGNACMAGRLYSTWVSATSPPAITPASTSIDIFFSSRIVCCVPQIQAPTSLNVADTCSGETGVGFLDVCNTGKEDLEVDSIVSDDPQFSVGTPSSGFPVAISPDFCFPFEVAFAPSGDGADSANLSIATNDPVNPMVTVLATANGLEPRIATVIADSGSFGDVCLGDLKDLDLTITNPGGCALTVTSISSNDPGVFQAPGVMSPPLVIGPGDSVAVPIRYQPDALGADAATITISSDDPDTPSKQVSVTGNTPPPDISTTIANNGDFGDVCRDDFKDLDLTITNSGLCALSVTDVSSNHTEFEEPGVMSYPLTVAGGTSVAVPIRFAPTTLGAKAATISVDSDDPDTPTKNVSVSGNVPPGDVRVTGSTDFGDVCAEDGLQEQPVSVCNVGPCDLAVISVSVDCADFTLINNPFPAPVSPDSCQDVLVRFTPTSAGPKTCTLTVVTDDPDEPVIELTLTANTPFASIDVSPDLGFRPTVIQSVDVCESLQPFPISNTGRCELTIPDVSISTNPAEYSLSGLPSFPIILERGGVVGEGDFRTVFAPDVLDRDREGQLSVTWVHDPVTGDTMSTDRALCGEAVRTGARVLVTHNGVPIGEVKSIRLNRINANRNNNRVDSVDNARRLALQTVTPAAPCAPFQYHREYGTVSNPIQLLPGTYQVTVQTRIDGKMKKRSVAFDVDACGFNPTILVDF
jgi:hypothetical protein